MKTAASTVFGRRFKIHNVESADSIGGGVLIDVKASGFCHSDLHMVKTDYGFPTPAVIGHEIAGIGSRVGSEGTGVAVGAHVVASLIQFWGTCENGTAGRTFDCPNPGLTLRGTENARIRTNGTTIVRASGIDECIERIRMNENQTAVVNTESPFPHAVSRVHR